MTEPAGSLARRTKVALFWSLVQTWGGRVSSSLLLVVLARILDPHDFGIASSVFLVLTVIHLFSEVGLGPAIVQRPGLEAADVNLPFYAVLFVSLSFMTGLIVLSGPLARAVGQPELAPYLAASAAIAPLMTTGAIQEAFYRREMRFRPLAARTVVSTLLGGLVGVGLALNGAGAWSLIAQFGTTSLIATAWNWLRPVWLPGLELRLRPALAMGRFGAVTAADFVSDVVVTKTVELLLLTKFGVATLGLYTLANRLCLTILQFMQASLATVGLTALSRISQDGDKMRALFVRSTSLSAMAIAPMFWALAAFAPEITTTIFGAKWGGVERYATPLLLLGGAQSVQYLAAPYLSATGHPHLLLRTGLLRAALVLPSAWLAAESGDALRVVLVFSAVTALAAPLVVGLGARILGVSARVLLTEVGLPLVAAAITFGGVEAWRATRHGGGAAGLGEAALVAVASGLGYAVLLLILARPAVLANIRFASRMARS